MPQLSLYVDSEALDLLREDAKKSNTSMSKYVTRLIKSRSDSAWPDGYWESVYGSLADETFVIPDELDPALDGPLPDFDSER